ncbi:MAG: prepilin-type N-terminal cleavage/methylation domain-containing protein [Planctomycetota bacterium]
MKVVTARPARGMTLIELLISIGILMGGMVCIFAFLLSGTSSHRRAIKETEATMIAASAMADLRGDFAAGTIPRSDGTTYMEVKNKPGYTLNRVILCVDPIKAEKREFFVRIRVRWSEKGDNQFIEFSSVMCSGKPKVLEP